MGLRHIQQCVNYIMHQHLLERASFLTLKQNCTEHLLNDSICFQNPFQLMYSKKVQKMWWKYMSAGQKEGENMVLSCTVH